MSLTDSLDDANSTGREILAALKDLDTTTGDANLALEIISQQMDELIEAQGGGGGGGGATGAASGGRRGGAGSPRTPSKAGRGGGGGGGFEAALAAARAHPAVAAAAVVAGVAGKHIGAGAVSAARGGEFTAGFESSINQTIGKLPFIGEGTGIAGGARIEAKTTQRIAQAVGQLEAIAGEGAVTPDHEKFLFEAISQQEKRREDAEERIRLRSQEFFRDNPNARGDRPRVDTEDVGIFMSPATWAFRKMMEGHGIGGHK